MLIEPKITIIIPIYNAETYIETCISSLVEQSYKNIEILCIDDGSTDNSTAIINKYANKDKRITVIKQENCGVSCARNVGINNTNGEYILFVDADDFLENNACELLIEKAVKTNADIIQFNHKKILSNNFVIYSERYNVSNQAFLLLEQPKKVFPKHDYIFCTDKLYKKEFLLTYNIFFDEKLNFAEDLCFILDIYKYNPLIYLSNDYLYNYVIQKKSACRNRTLLELFSTNENLNYTILKLLNNSNNKLKIYAMNCAFYTILRLWNIFYDSKYKNEYIKKLNEYLSFLEIDKKQSNYKLAKKYLFVEKYKLSKIYWNIFFPIERYLIKFGLKQAIIRLENFLDRKH